MDTPSYSRVWATQFEKLATPTGLPQPNKINGLGVSNHTTPSIEIQGEFSSLSNRKKQRNHADVIGNVSPLDRKLKATIFRSQRADTKIDINRSLRDIEKLILKTTAPSKESCPWIKAARFGDEKTDKNCLRHDSNVKTVDGVEIDSDSGVMPMAEAVQRCNDKGLAALFYESASSTPEKQRYRALFPCSKSLPPEQREALVALANGVLGGTIDNQASFTLSQSFYFGNIKDEPKRQTELVEGRYIDLAHDLVKGAIGQGGKADSDEHENDESRSGAAFKEAMAIYLRGGTVAEFSEWASENVWRDYEANPTRAIDHTWANAIKRCKVDGLDPMPPVTFEDETNTIPEPVAPLTVTATPFTIKGLAAIPQREWLYSRCYARRLLSAVAATGGVGKSVLIIGEALAIATGKPLLGELPPMGAKRVWHINSEDDKEELDRRFEAAIELHSITQADLQNRLFYTGNETRFVIAKEDKSGLKIAHPIVAAIKAEIRRLRIDVLTVDPFVSTHTVSENSNDKINAVAGLWRDIAQECNCSVVLVHHMRKPASSKPGQDATSYTVDDARGAGAFKDATRSFRIVNKMTEATAAKLGLEDHWRYLHVTDGKANYSPPASAGKWFKLVSVGATAHDAGIGAVEPWQYPAVAEGVSTPNLRRAIEALRDGTGRHDPRSPQWAGKRVLATLGLEAADKAKGKALLSAWVKEGYLTIESRQDDNRVWRDYYVVKNVPESGFQDESETDSDDGERGVE